MSNVYEVITDRIVSALDAGIVPWRQPWRAASDMPRNLRGRAYRGINVWLLLMAARAKGYGDPRWLTFKQSTELGGRVKRGEKGMPVVLWKPTKVEERDPNTGQTREKTVPLIRYYTVFNVAQCEDIAVAPLAVPTNEVDPIEACEAIVAAYPGGPTILHDGGNRAYYLPATDAVHLPRVESFSSSEGYYATKFHELGHSTGHESRLARQGITSFDHFGSGRYAREELVAEMTAAFLAGEAGIAPAVVDNTVAYIQNWRQVLTDDPRAVVTAAAQAQKAADLVLGRQVAQQEGTAAA